MFKKIKSTSFALVIFFMVAGATYLGVMFWLESKFGSDPVKTNVVTGEQGQPIQVAPEPKTDESFIDKISSTLDPDPVYTVTTEVKKMPLSQLATQPIEEGLETNVIQPDQAVVKREEDRHGNTTVTILTPVAPVEDELEHDIGPSSDSSGQLEKPIKLPSVFDQITAKPFNPLDAEWFVVETEVYIPHVPSKLKVVGLMSFDFDFELGIGYEFWRLKEKPIMLPDNMFKWIQNGSADVILTNRRIGVGGSLELKKDVDVGVGISLQWSPEREVEGFVYGSYHF